MKFACIHGHFYQPPRENPWLEEIELQDSAYPYHDWNERITAESYAPNAATRIHDAEGRIVRIVNNYSRISFNFGPTVLSWAYAKATPLHKTIVEADKESQKTFSGHGSAIAQAYNHMIMPLANRRDKYTQVAWGIADFFYRFERKPEGMWLPETAVDLETLDIFAELGIKFAILAPSQAHLVRRIGGTDWVDVTGGQIDPTRAYRITTPSNRTLALFFYDGPISRAVAFEGLLNNGEVFGQRLMSGFSDARTWPQLTHIATDGESYGHHHRFGEMALAYALDYLEKKGITITNYGEFLEKFEPTHEVEIYENTAWSCAHGVGRWNSDCGCNSGGHPGWKQAWRAPLRSALDWLRDEVAPKYERRMEKCLGSDAWNARNRYIDVVLDRSPAVREQFLATVAHRPLADTDKVQIWKLLELQRHAMLMYTSCGWFFDEISGIETVQVIEYAARVVQLAEELFGEPVEARFLAKLALAKSNLPGERDGAHIYETHIRPSLVNLEKVGAHYAISSMFQPYENKERIYAYSVEREDFRSSETGRLRLAMGRARFTSEITLESDLLTFGVLHFGDHNLNGAVRPYAGLDRYEALIEDILQAFGRADIPEVIRLMDKGFGLNNYSLKSLFRDEQRKCLEQILNAALVEAEIAYRQLYEHNAPFMRFLADLGTPAPKAFVTTAQYALNSLLRNALSAEELDQSRIKSLIDEVRLSEVELDKTTLEFTFRRTLERLATQAANEPGSQARLQRLSQGTSLLPFLPFPVTVWTVQNICYGILQDQYATKLQASENGDEEAKLWIGEFDLLARELLLRVP